MSVGSHPTAAFNSILSYPLSVQVASLQAILWARSNTTTILSIHPSHGNSPPSYPPDFVSTTFWLRKHTSPFLPYRRKKLHPVPDFKPDSRISCSLHKAKGDNVMFSQKMHHVPFSLHYPIFHGLCMCHFSPICPFPKLSTSVGYKSIHFQCTKYFYYSSNIWELLYATFHFWKTPLISQRHSLDSRWYLLQILSPNLIVSPRWGDWVTNLCKESPVRGSSRFLLQLQVKDGSLKFIVQFCCIFSNLMKTCLASLFYFFEGLVFLLFKRTLY